MKSLGLALLLLAQTVTPASHTAPAANTYPCKVVAPLFIAVYRADGTRTQYNAPYSTEVLSITNDIPVCAEPPLLKDQPK